MLASLLMKVYAIGLISSSLIEDRKTRMTSVLLTEMFTGNWKKMIDLYWKLIDWSLLIRVFTERLLKRVFPNRLL